MMQQLNHMRTGVSFYQIVVSFCKTFHTCQFAGKPNQVVPPAPLSPILAVGEPYEHIIVDCVAPLSRTKSGNQFLLTVMCCHWFS